MKSLPSLQKAASESKRPETTPSTYSMLSSKSGEFDQAKVTVANGHFFQETSRFNGNLAGLQTQEDKDMENKWKEYVAIKKQKKQANKTNKLLNNDLTDSERMRLLPSVEELLSNIKK